MKDIVRLTDANFTGQSIQNHTGNSLVIFSADWCPYCVSFFNNWEEYGKIDNTLIADVTDVDSKLWDDFDLNVRFQTPKSVIGHSYTERKSWMKLKEGPEKIFPLSV